MASSVSPSPIQFSCNDFIIYGDFLIQKAESMQVIAPVVSYKFFSLSYIPPISAIVLSCMDPGKFMYAMGMVLSGQNQKTDVTKWLCFQPL